MKIVETVGFGYFLVNVDGFLIAKERTPNCVWSRDCMGQLMDLGTRI